MIEFDEGNEAEEDYNEEEHLDDNVKRAKYIMEVGRKEGHLEAPIDLNISKMTKIELSPLKWYNYNIVPKKIKLMNTGATVTLSAKWHDEGPYLADGPFPGKYVFSQLHFHWGENEMLGSEHRLDGSCLPMELHVVHFKADYRSHEEALRHDDGLAILVYLFRLQCQWNRGLDEVLDNLSQIREPGDSVRPEPRQALTELLRPFADDYFLYWGALLSASALGQRVLWLVSRAPLFIAQEQISPFRLLRDSRHEALLRNCRAIKERGERSVFHANPSGHTASSLMMISSG